MQVNTSDSEQAYVEEKMKRHTLFYKRIYHILYTLNDLMLGLWFLIGSILFYFETLKTWGIHFFVLGSLQFILKPTIRLIHELDARKHYRKEYEHKKAQD